MPFLLKPLLIWLAIILCFIMACSEPKEKVVISYGRMYSADVKDSMVKPLKSVEMRDIKTLISKIKDGLEGTTDMRYIRLESKDTLHRIFVDVRGHQGIGCIKEKNIIRIQNKLIFTRNNSHFPMDSLFSIMTKKYSQRSNKIVFNITFDFQDSHYFKNVIQNIVWNFEKINPGVNLKILLFEPQESKKEFKEQLIGTWTSTARTKDGISSDHRGIFTIHLNEDNTYRSFYKRDNRKEGTWSTVGVHSFRLHTKGADIFSVRYLSYDSMVTQVNWPRDTVVLYHFKKK